MTPIEQRMIEDMQLRNFSPHTQYAYARAVAGCSKHVKTPAKALDANHVRTYLLHLVQKWHARWSLYNQTRCAHQFFFRVTLSRGESLQGVPCARGHKRLPIVLSQDELRRFFAAIHNPKHKALFMTAYATGLRVSELVSLRTEDVDSGRMLIRVQHGKGQRERCVKLSPQLLRVLRDYCRACKPDGWLFPGQTSQNPIGRLAVNRIRRSPPTSCGLGQTRERPHFPSHVCHAHAGSRCRPPHDPDAPGPSTTSNDGRLPARVALNDSSGTESARFVDRGRQAMIMARSRKFAIGPSNTSDAEGINNRTL
jgi:integrase/recombinase XerD